MATKKRTPDFVIEADVEKSTREQDLPAARRTPVPKPRFALVLVLALAASVAVALTACGGDDNKSSTSNSSPSSTSGSATKAAGTSQPADATKPGQTVAGKPTDPCQILTKEDASAALGANDVGDPASNSQTTNNVTTQQCTYASKTSGVVSMATQRSTSQEQGNNFMAARRGTSSAIDVAGVGEQASYDPTIGELFVLVKDTNLVISLGKPFNRPGTPTPELIALAKKLIAKI